MKKKFYYGAALAVLLVSVCTACNNEETAEVMGGKAPLSVNIRTSAVDVKGELVTGDAFASGKDIGVVVVQSADGQDYEGQQYGDIKYTSAGEGSSQTWTPSKPVYLSHTEATAYAYYPYEAGTDIGAIDLQTDVIEDYMYADPVTGLSNSNATAGFQMKHAMAAVQVTLKKGTYTGTGSYTGFAMKSNTAGNAGTLNAKTGTVTATGEGTAFTLSASGSIVTAGATFTQTVVPTQTADAVTFDLMLDGAKYQVKSESLTFQSGDIYTFTITVNSNALTVSPVSVVPWNTVDKGSLEAKPVGPWDNVANGVYAVNAAGEPVDYTAVTGDKSSYKGVAVIKGEHKFMIQRDHDKLKYYIWDENYTNGLGLNRYSKADGTNNYGYLAGSFSPQLEKDFTKWTAGALADFAGKANSDAILAAELTSSTMSDYLKSYRDTNGDEWYIPACGQLALIYLNLAEINQALTAIDATGVKQLSSSGAYWSSSEYNSSNAWSVYFSNGYVYSYDSKERDFSVVLVQDL